MFKRIVCMVAVISMVFMSGGCSKEKEAAKIGVSFGVGPAARWGIEADYMKERAEELGAEIEVRLNRTDEPKTQEEDCKELIDSGIDVLLLTPRDVNKVGSIIDYAKEKDVKVISYARLVTGKPIDLFVGYDSSKIGQLLGQYLAETVDQGDYIILKGDEGDYNSDLLYSGAMRYIDPIKDNINILLDSPVEGWSADKAKEMVLEAVKKNNNEIDAILAPNDKLAGACVEVLEELGIEKDVVLTGMDAELDAVKRIVNGKQSITIYMDLKDLATKAIDEAYHMAMDEEVNVNASFDNKSEKDIDANLITGKLVMDKNLDKILIDSGYYTKEQIYGE